MTNRTTFSFSWMLNTDANVITQAEARALATVGFTACRLADSAPISAPAEGQWNFWQCLQPNVSRLWHAGIRANVDTCWCPPHMAFGLNTYMPYVLGATVWNMDANGDAYPAGHPQHGQHYAAHRPWVTEPPHMTGWYEYGRRQALAVGEWTNTTAIGNELGGDFYNPLVHFESRWDEAYARQWFEQSAPYFRGFLSVRPRARFTLPDADGADALRRGIEFSRRDPQIDAAVEAYSYHPYAWRTLPDGTKDFPADSYERIAEFRAVIKQYGRPGVPEWMSEIGDDNTGRIVEWTAHVLEDAEPPANINYANRAQFVRCTNPDDPEPEREYALTDVGRELQALIIYSDTERRRPSAPGEQV